MTRTRRFFALAFSVLSVLWVFVIFSNSLETVDESNEKSRDVVEIIIEKVFREDIETISKKDIGIFHNFIRKAAHFTEFAVLSLLVFLALSAWNLKEYLTRFVPVLCAFTVACADEIIQYFVPGRACRFTDVLIDTGGALTLIIIVLVLKRLFSKFKYMRL